MRKITTVSIAVGILAMVSTDIHADESGVPFWFSGAYSSLAATPATPGWSMPSQAYYYSGGASQSKSFTHGDTVTAGLNSRVPLLLVQPSYAPKTPLWGGQASFGLGFGYGTNRMDDDISMSCFGMMFVF